MAATACAPPTLNTRSTPATAAATSVCGFTFPSACGGVHMMISSTPATCAGTAFISTVEGYCARPPGT